MNKREMLLSGVAAVALMGSAFAPPAEAQSSVQQSAAMLNAATFLQGPTGGRTTCSTSQDTVANLTVTITPPAGNYVYITGVNFTGLANATGATSTTVWSTTNLTGSPAFLTPFTATAAANPSSVMSISDSYPTGLRSTVAGTAVTFVPQATSASAFLCPRIAGFFNAQ